MALSKQDRPLPSGFFLTDEKRTPDVLNSIKRLPAGVGVIFRHYQFPERVKLAEKVVEVCKNQRRICLIGADHKLALRVGASGLHLPKWFQQAGLGAAPFDPRWLITASAHGVSGLNRAEAFGADAVLLAPLFPTSSHQKIPFLGVHKFSRLSRMTTLPVYALGGVTAENIRCLPPIKNLAGPAGISLYL